jgi:hypothetical protein
MASINHGGQTNVFHQPTAEIIGIRPGVSKGLAWRVRSETIDSPWQAHTERGNHGLPKNFIQAHHAQPYMPCGWVTPNGLMLVWGWAPPPQGE